MLPVARLLFSALLLLSSPAFAQTASVETVVVVTSADGLTEEMDPAKLQQDDLPDTNACHHWYDEDSQTYRVDC